MVEKNNVYCGDCFELIKQIPDNSIDLVITDPPYSFVRNTTGGGAIGTKKRDYHKEYTDVFKKNKNISELGFRKRKNTDSTTKICYGFDNAILDELCRVMKYIYIYIWCSKAQITQILNYFENKGCFIDLLTWHKTNPIPTCNGTYLNDTEYLILAREKGTKIQGTYHTKRKWYVTQINKSDKKKYGHPTIKPEFIIENLIVNSSQKGDTVLDVFMGSGTTCVCAKRLGRNYIGFEIEEKWFETAKKRIEETEIENETETEQKRNEYVEEQLSFF